MLDTPIAVVFTAPYSKILIVLFPQLPEAVGPGDMGHPFK
jgi:hypothetical protein